MAGKARTGPPLWNPTSLHPKSSKTISKTCGRKAITWSTNNENRRLSENVWTAFCNLPALLLVFEAKCQQMRSDFLNSILIPIQCDPIRPPRSCLLTLLVAHTTGPFYQTELLTKLIDDINDINEINNELSIGNWWVISCLTDYIRCSGWKLNNE